jgi:hypothetical protein
MTTWTHKIVWEALVWAIGSASTWETLTGTTEFLSDVIDLIAGGYDVIEFFAQLDPDATPTDDVDVNIYGDRDGSSPDDTPFASLRIDKGKDPNQISDIVEKRSKIMFGMVQTGSTNTHNVRLAYRLGRSQSIDT